MTYDDFKQRVEGAGLTAKYCASGHWQIMGGVVPVNFWPYAKGGQKFYIQGAKHSKIGTLTEAIETVINGRPNPPRTPAQRCRDIMLRKLVSFAICHWCHKPLSAEDATVDHVIPKSKGGPDNFANIVPACHECNRKRGNSLLPPWEEPKVEQPEEKLVIYNSWWRVVGDAVALAAATAAGFGLVWWISQ